MIKQCTKFLFVIAAAVLLFVVTARALPSHTGSFYINDFANILNQETKDYVFSSSKILDEKTTAQIVVVTVESLEGQPLDDYAVNLGNQWGIGSKEKNNGLLILLALKERKVKVEIGRGLEGKMNDAKAGRFLDNYAVPYFNENNWDEGIKALYSVILSEVYSEYDMEVPEDVASVASEYKDFDVGNDIVFIIIAVLLGFGGIFFWWIRSLFRNGHHWGSGSSGSGWFGGGGGFSSGGGGGYSGGGGSFGGGGASRGF